MKYAKMIESHDAPYDFALGLETGVKLLGSGNYPDLNVLSATEHPVKEIRWQMLRVKAEHPNQEGDEQLIIGRLVAVLDNDNEVEVGDRTVVPADIVDTGIDMTTCASCKRKNLDPRTTKVIEGAAYCPVCVI